MADERTDPNDDRTRQLAADTRDEAGEVNAIAAEPPSVSRARRHLYVELGLLLAVGVGLLLWPAVPRPHGQSLRGRCHSHLRYIGLALNHYHEMHGAYPPAFVADENGRPMHSWRVLLLDYLEYTRLYDQYNFDEPWDSPNNLKVAAETPRVYQCPNAAALPAGHTNYLAITGPGCVFDGEKRTRWNEITDGAAETLLVVESTDTSVLWTQPIDLDARPMTYLINNGPEEVGSGHTGGANVVLCDGHVVFLPNDTSPMTVKAMTTIAGGERVKVPD